MKIVVIGGTGHIGTYLIPKLAMKGHEIICVTRNISKPYDILPAWEFVKQIKIDRTEAEEKGVFGDKIRALKADIVIDLICFTLESATILVEALSENIQHFIHCGTMWVHGHSQLVPTLESQERNPFGQYGINKAKIESYLLFKSQQIGFPATILHPGHITGPGWLPINPAGNLNPDVFLKLAKGEELILPNIGMETVHHVHASDVAQAFINTIENRPNALGESFHIVSEQAITLRGYANAMAKWFGKQAKLKFLPWEEWKNTVSETEAKLTWDHIAHSPNGSIAKAKKLITYIPKYSSLQAVQESIEHYFEKEHIML
ncbi:NAD-dependent epimerase/dehydratase family protein [Gaetbulibacter sp. M235]|uniref:NAD-dependent epimerase/dehydratase family protein n=1 Tax=Gaetbulibacter sp. M235 TaxID=3126510 RepID=UPI00374F586B